MVVVVTVVVVVIVVVIVVGNQTVVSLALALTLAVLAATQVAAPAADCLLVGAPPYAAGYVVHAALCQLLLNMSQCLLHKSWLLLVCLLG